MKLYLKSFSFCQAVDSCILDMKATWQWYSQTGLSPNNLQYFFEKAWPEWDLAEFPASQLA